MSNLAGSCNCGEIRFVVNGDVRTVVNCHCNLCRKMNGSAFSTYVVVLGSEFSLESGELQTIRVSEQATKSVCERCNTPIYNENPKYQGLRMLHLGSVDDPVDLEPQVNIYCESQLDWLSGVTGLTNMDQGIR